MKTDRTYLADASVILACIRPSDLRIGEEPEFALVRGQATDILKQSCTSAVQVAEVLDVLVRAHGYTAVQATEALGELAIPTLPYDAAAARHVAFIRAMDPSRELLSICDCMAMAHAKSAGLQPVTGDLRWLLAWGKLPPDWMLEPIAFRVMNRRPGKSKRSAT